MCYKAVIMLVVVVGLSKKMDLPVKLTLLDSISSSPHPLVKLVAILARQWAKEAYIQQLQDVCRVKGEVDRVNISFVTPLGLTPMREQAKLWLRLC